MIEDIESEAEEVETLGEFCEKLGAIDPMLRKNNIGRKGQGALTAPQIQQIQEWMEQDEPLSDIAKRCKADLGRAVTYRTLERIKRKVDAKEARLSLAENAEGARALLEQNSDASSVEEAAVAMLTSRALEVLNSPNLSPAKVREVMGLVVRLREQRIQLQRLELDRFKLQMDVAEMVIKHLDKLKASGVLQMEDRSEAVDRIRLTLFGSHAPRQENPSMTSK